MIDHAYYTKKLNTIVRDIKMYTNEELSRALLRLALTSDKKVIHEDEFQKLIHWRIRDV